MAFSRRLVRQRPCKGWGGEGSGDGGVIGLRRSEGYWRKLALPLGHKSGGTCDETPCVVLLGGEGGAWHVARVHAWHTCTLHVSYVISYMIYDTSTEIAPLTPCAGARRRNLSAVA
eukprot:361595-Chlamydomonas_euryale.AAC.1